MIEEEKESRIYDPLFNMNSRKLNLYANRSRKSSKNAVEAVFVSFGRPPLNESNEREEAKMNRNEMKSE